MEVKICTVIWISIICTYLVFFAGLVAIFSYLERHTYVMCYVIASIVSVLDVLAKSSYQWLSILSYIINVGNHIDAFTAKLVTNTE